MRPRRVTELDGDPDARASAIAMCGIEVIELTCGAIEVRANGQGIRMTRDQAWAIAAGLLELARMRTCG
ncbi:MAG: hypothetical protein ABI867_19575 [Kofleriaceae bacterium]